MTTVAAPPPATALLAVDRRPGGWDVARVVEHDRPRRGAMCLAVRPGVVRRAEPGPCGPLLLEARSLRAEIELSVRGPAGTPPEASEAALAAAGGWAGLDDDLAPFTALLDAHPMLRRLDVRLGETRLSRMPRVGEAVGRTILAQLVQSVEARRSMTQVAAAIGASAGDALWHWPEPRKVAATPMWTLRRCGVSLKATQALHAAALADSRLTAASRDWARFDALLRALPGIGAWTSGEARLSLGDPDAVPVGDWNIPAVIGTALTGEQRSRGAWSDEEMLALLAPFAGQRGRVIRLVGRAVGAGLAPRHSRRAPRAALSAHRYW